MESDSDIDIDRGIDIDKEGHIDTKKDIYLTCRTGSCRMTDMSRCGWKGHITYLDIWRERDIDKG